MWTCSSSGDDGLDCEGAIVAFKTRSIVAGDAIAHLLVALEWLRAPRSPLAFVWSEWLSLKSKT
jgi:hypothetical protein